MARRVISLDHYTTTHKKQIDTLIITHEN